MMADRSDGSWNPKSYKSKNVKSGERGGQFSSSTQSLLMMADRSHRSWNPKSYKSKNVKSGEHGGQLPTPIFLSRKCWSTKSITTRLAGKSLIYQDLTAWFLVKGISVAYQDKKKNPVLVPSQRRTIVNFLWTQRAQNTLSMVLARSCSEHFCSFSYAPYWRTLCWHCH